MDHPALTSLAGGLALQSELRASELKVVCVASEFLMRSLAFENLFVSTKSFWNAILRHSGRKKALILYQFFGGFFNPEM